MSDLENSKSDYETSRYASVIQEALCAGCGLAVIAPGEDRRALFYDALAALAAMVKESVETRRKLTHWEELGPVLTEDNLRLVREVERLKNALEYAQRYWLQCQNEYGQLSSEVERLKREVQEMTALRKTFTETHEAGAAWMREKAAERIDTCVCSGNRERIKAAIRAIPTREKP